MTFGEMRVTPPPLPHEELSPSSIYERADSHECNQLHEIKRCTKDLRDRQVAKAYGSVSGMLIVIGFLTLPFGIGVPILGVALLLFISAVIKATPNK